MKKLLFLLLIALSGCKCLLSQIPPQYLYAGADCTAELPNYVEKVTVTDNCALATVVQTPAPGYLLDAVNQIVNVTIRATDVFNNSSEVTFTVTLLDTIPPVITADLTVINADDTVTYNTLVASMWEEVNRLYDRADLMIADAMEYFDESFPYEDFGIIKNDVDSTYYKRMMMTWTGPGHAKTSKGYRIWTFPMPFDTIILDRW